MITTFNHKFKIGEQVLYPIKQGSKVMARAYITGIIFQENYVPRKKITMETIWYILSADTEHSGIYHNHPEDELKPIDYGATINELG